VHSLVIGESLIFFGTIMLALEEIGSRRLSSFVRFANRMRYSAGMIYLSTFPENRYSIETFQV
jgi:hypothetical protein